MKLLLPLILTASLQAEHVLLLSGLALHSNKTNFENRKYDVVIEGAGYQYRTECGNFDCSGTILAINDSNSHFMPIVSLGATYDVFWNIGIGAELGVASKQFMNERRTIPIAMPKAEIVFEYVIVNISYFHLPSTEDAYANFGIKF